MILTINFSTNTSQPQQPSKTIPSQTGDAKVFVYTLHCPGDPTHPDIFGADGPPILYATREIAERALKAYIEDFPGDDPPPGILEIEVTQEF